MVRRIAEDRNGVAEHVNTGIKQFIADYCPAGCDGQVQRVASCFALAACAAREATRWSVLPWDGGEGHRAASACFTAWLNVRGGIGSAELQEGLAQVRTFIQQHGASRFEDLDAEYEQRTINRAGYRQRVDGELRYCIHPETFRREVCPGHDAKAILRELGRLGLIFRESGRRTLSVRTMDGKQKRHVISSRVLQKTTGDTGGSGDTPDIAEENMSPPHWGQLGTPGTDDAVLKAVPTRKTKTGDKKTPVISGLSPVSPLSPVKAVRTQMGRRKPKKHTNAGR